MIRHATALCIALGVMVAYVAGCDGVAQPPGENVSDCLYLEPRLTATSGPYHETIACATQDTTSSPCAVGVVIIEARTGAEIEAQEFAPNGGWDDLWWMLRK